MKIPLTLLLTFGLAAAALAQGNGVSPVPPSTPFTRWLMGATNQGDFAARLGITVIPPGTTTNTFYGAFRGLDFGVTNQNGQTIAQLISAMIGAGVPPWSGSNYIFVSYSGNDTNSGLTRNLPLQHPWNACLLATNMQAKGFSNLVIDAMPGQIDGTPTVHLPDNVDWISESGSQLIWTNPFINTISYAGFTPGNNSHIWNLNMLNPDPGNSAIPIGEGASDGSDPMCAGKTNWVFYNLNLVTYATGLHWETPVDTVYRGGTFINPVILANRCPVVMESINIHILLVNPILTCLNFTNNKIANSKPLACIEFNHFVNLTNGPALQVVGGQLNYSDIDLSNSNRPVYAVWSGSTNGGGIGLLGTNVGISMSGTLLNPVSITNPASYDLLGSTNGTYLLNNVITVAGNYPSVTNVTPGTDCLIHGMATTPIGNPTNAILSSDGHTRIWTNLSALNLATSTNLPSSSVIGGNGTTPAPAGTVGEIISAGYGLDGQTNLTSGSAGVITNIVLTPGTWLITGNVVFNEQSATVFSRVACMGPNVGLNMGAGGNNIFVDAFNDAVTTTTSQTNSLIAPTYYYTTATIANFYLSERVVFTAGSVSACGKLQAMRLY